MSRRKSGWEKKFRKANKRPGLVYSADLRDMMPRGSVLSDRAVVNGSGLVQKVEGPDDEKELIKTVPAKVDGTVVGEAFIYNDGSVDVKIDPDAPEWAVEKIKATEKEFGYRIGGI